MWGSKALSRGVGMATATSIFYGYGVNEGFALLILTMSFVLIAMLSKELDYKAGFETKLYKNRLTLYELFSGMQSLTNESALAAMIFCFCEYWIWYF